MGLKRTDLPGKNGGDAGGRTRITAVAAAIMGFLSVATVGVVAFLAFGPPGVELGGWFLPLTLSAMGEAVAAVLLYMTAWFFAWGADRKLSRMLGRPLAWAVGVFGVLLPSLLILTIGGLLLVSFLAGAGG